MNKPKSKSGKKVKAWGVFHTGVKDLSDTIFKEKHEAMAYISTIAYPFLSEVPLERIKEILDQYKVIPIEITYKFPQD